MHQKKFSKEQLKSTFFLVSETLIFHFQIIINYLQEPVEDKYPLVRNDSEMLCDRRLYNRKTIFSDTIFYLSTSQNLWYNSMNSSEKRLFFSNPKSVSGNNLPFIYYVFFSEVTVIAELRGISSMADAKFQLIFILNTLEKIFPFALTLIFIHH